MTEQAYDRLAEPLRRFIYKNHWNRLTDLQNQMIQAVLDTKNSLIISAGTASGKTEAAMFPVISTLYENPKPGVRVLYISPLRALINDQYRRMQDILGSMSISVVRYHSDVGEQKKRMLRTEENLIVMLTPESLESLLMNERALLASRMQDLDFVIIDEMHYFMESERGIQLLAVLERLQHLIGRIPRRIGLSATIGNAEIASQWLKTDTHQACRVLEDRAQKKQYRLMISGYEEETAKIRILKGLTQGKRSLVFLPSKRELAETEGLLQGGQPVYVHHAGVSAEIRRDTENRLRSSQKPATVLSTTTLELGIDIGSLERVLQIGVPLRITSLVQRLGRSGRRGAPAEMALLVQLKKDGMHWELLQAIAVIRLFTEKQWMETPKSPEKPFHILLQQILAVVRSEPPMTTTQLKQRFSKMEVYAHVEPMEWELLYQHMYNEDLLEAAEDGTILLGIKGESIVASRDFYTVFMASEEPREDEEVDSMQASVFTVNPDTRVDVQILRMMLSVLEDTCIYPWLTQNAKDALTEDREMYRRIPESQKGIDTEPVRNQKLFKYAALLPPLLLQKERESGSDQDRSLQQQIQEWKRRWKYGTE